MEIVIHRGENQIGGNIIEISTDKTRILLDVGRELDEEEVCLPDIDGLFDVPAFDAVFISHYHGDHIGLAYYIDKSIPIYLGEASTRIVQAADAYKRTETIRPAGFLIHGKPIRVGDITVTPFLCDHSAFDSYMLLCEADGETILYTGDFRANGRKSFDRLLHDLPGKVDKLICEGTTLSREGYIPVTEAELEEQAVAMFKETKSPVFVLQSSANIDRIVTMYRAAKRTGRIFLQELFMAELATAAGSSIPNPAFDDVYAFITNPKRYEELTKYRRIGKDGITKSRFVMCVRTSMLRYMQSLSEQMPFDGGLLIYSMWSGYRRQPEMDAFLRTCEEMGLRVVELHTSGHADADTICKLIANVHPGEVIPVHTENAAWFQIIKSEAAADQKRELYDRQVALLDTFLEHRAISQEQHDKSLHDLTVKMGYGDKH